MRMLAVAAAAIFLSACANAIESRTADGGGVGLSYMAPMRLLTITATRAPPAETATVATARTALVTAELELQAATTALRDARNETNAARALLAAAPNNATLQTAHTTKQAAQELAQARVTAANTAVANARVAYQHLSNAHRDDQAHDAALSQLRSSVAILLQEQRGLAAATDDVDRATRTRRVQTAENNVIRHRDAYAQILLVTGPLRETVEVTMGPAVGDPNARFVANVSGNWFRSARGRIVVGQNGLLQSANLTVDGQLDEALVGVAQSIVALQSAGGRSTLEGKGLLEDASDRQCDDNGDLTQAGVLRPEPLPLPMTLSLTFDPVRESDVRRVNQALCGAAFGYRINVRDGQIARRLPESMLAFDAAPAGEVHPRTIPGPPVAPSVDERNPLFTTNFRTMCGLTVGRGENQRRRCPGLVYRQNQPMNIDVSRFDSVFGRRAYVERSFSFSVPNAAPVDVLRYDDAIFVTRRDDVGFVDGSLVSLDFDRPSEAAVAASIPFRIVRGTTEALSELVQLRVNLANQEAALATAQQTAANNQASGAASAEIQQLQNAQRLLELRLQVEEARQRLLEAEARAAGSGD